MNVKIIIDKTIVYHPKTHMLYTIDDEHNSINIAMPASMCLMLLIEKQGEIVSQSELLDVAWHQRGISVSANTLYQNIFLLRKSLEKMGGIPALIRTIPKRGFTISNEISIVFDKQLSEPTEAIIPEDLTLQDVSVSSKGNETETEKETESLQIKPMLTAAILSLFFVIFAVATFFLSTYTIPTYKLDSYTALTQIEDCKVFRNRSLRPDVFFEDVIRYNQLKCGNAKWWYITNTPPSTRLSLIQCTYPINSAAPGEKRLCQSSYYLKLKSS